MSGYIDENARIADDIHNAYEEGYADGKRDAVKHGHWIHNAEYDDNGLCDYYCSRCGNYTVGSIDLGVDNYCSKCGAMMDEVTE